MKHLLNIIIVTVLFISCSKNDEIQIPLEKDYSIENEKEITTYIAENNLNATRSNSGLYYVINNLGSGKQPNSTSNVTVAYKGYFTNGNIFDQSGSDGSSFDLNRLIKGWIEGIPYFKEGGDGILLVPAHLAYGSNSVGIIPEGSVLIYDVKLISVNN